MSDAVRTLIYCDTSCLPGNIRGEENEPELEALKQLQARFDFYGSRFVREEASATAEPQMRDALIVQCNTLKPVPKDEKILGFHSQFDRFGGCCWPMIADTHDDALCEELKNRGLKPKDAQHITQAVCNECGVFLTRDVKTIIRPYGEWLEMRLHPLKFWKPSELLKALESGWPQAA
jgi:hypothetical protein